MPVQLEGAMARLTGSIGAEEAADLAEWLAAGGARVRLEGVEHLHSAVLQCLMAWRPAIACEGVSDFVAGLLARAVPTEETGP